MGFLSDVNEFFGVSPPDLIKRITVALIAVIIVMSVDVLMLLGQGLDLIDNIPFMNERVVSTIILASVMFSLSLIYYVVHGGHVGKSEVYK